MKPVIILSLGGSLVVPDKIDARYLARFTNFILRNLRRWRFIIVVGGGKLCRRYQAAAKILGVQSVTDLDWVGIVSTRLNAELVRAAFGSKAEKRVATNPAIKKPFAKPVLVAAGYEPGWSTDYDSVLLACAYGAKRVVNLTNLDYVYDLDPKKFKSARALPNLSWSEFRKITGSKWAPGINKPFDPVASRLAQQKGIEVIIVNGRNLQNLQQVLAGQKFVGTRIK